MKIYGPYLRKDGRQHVILVENGVRRTVSYPKWLMEEKLGRKLDPDLETIDHIDRDFTNNNFDNLRIISRVQHSIEDANRANPIVVACVFCGKEFKTCARQYNANRRQEKAGPFCGRSCSGKYGRQVQLGQITKMEIGPTFTNYGYYKLKEI